MESGNSKVFEEGVYQDVISQLEPDTERAISAYLEEQTETEAYSQTHTVCTAGTDLPLLGRPLPSGILS
jgi:hypothetical protein